MHDALTACEPAPSSGLINTLKKAPANFLDIQDRLLDSTADSLVLLTDLAKGLRTGQSCLAPSDSCSAGVGQAILYPFVIWPQNPPPHPWLPLAAPVHAPGARHGMSLICSLVLRRYRSSGTFLKLFRTAGFQVLGHSCFSARLFSVREDLCAN